MTRLLSHFGRRSELISRLLVLLFVAVPFPAPSFEVLERWSPYGFQLRTPLADAALTAPNLVPTALTAPASATPHQNISISWTVANQGNGPAQPAWHDVLYLSTDPVCCGSVVTVVKDAYHTTTLAAGASYTNFDTAVRVPQAPAGHYYLILVVDSTDAVSESNESNNQRAVPITITTPDLVPTAFTVPTSAVAGSSTSISWTVTNQGSGIAAPGADNVYFSDTPTCCDDVAVFLGGVGGPPALNPGASYTRTTTVTIPTSLTIFRGDRWITLDVRAGTYYLMLRVDSNSFVYEADETNNLRIVPITITTPDLVPTVLSAPPSASTQQTLSISWTVANQGTGLAQAPWTDAVYLSTGPAVCGFPREGDILLTSTTRTVALAPGGSYTGTRTGVFVPHVPAGQYYLFVRVDDQLSSPTANSTNVYEADGANNCRSVPFTITTPDLVPTAVTGPGSASTQQAISVSWTVKNQGTASTVVGWNDTLYFSPNPACCTGATSFGSSSHSTLAAGQSYTQPKTLTVPSVPAGTYYLIVQADSGNVLSEVNEGNNERATAITITTPDLVPTSLRADPTPVLAKQLISVSWTVLNQGAGPTPPALTWSDAVYISPSPVCCTGATLLGSWVQSAAVPAGTSYGQTKSVTVPSLAPGTYYLIAWTDAAGRIYEADDSNNRLAVPVTVTGTSAGRLAITSVNGGSHPRAGTAFPVVVEARDPSGMTRTVASSTAVSLFLGSGTGVLGGTLTGTIPAGASRVTIGGVTDTKAENGVVLIASRTNGDALAPGNSVPFTVDPGAIASYAVTSSSPEPLGNTFAVSVTARDQFANTVTTDSSTLVTLSSSSGHVLFDSNVDGVFGDTTKALAAGTFSMNAKGTVAETTSVIAKDAKGKTGSASLTVTAASTLALAFTTQPGSAPAASAIPGPPTVAVQDGFGNTVTTSTASITIAIGTNPSGGILGGTTTKAASTGIASFGDVTISQPGSGYTLTASASGLTGATSRAFTVTAATGTISGRVTRASDGAALSGAAVSALQVGLVKGSATTGVDGTYSMTGLAPGSYDVRASTSGFQPRTQAGIAISAGSTVSVNFSLAATPGPTIRITAPAAGTTITRFTVLVRGEFTAPAGTDVGVAINGHVADASQGQFGAIVPLQLGANTITATLVDPAGNTASDTVVVQVPTQQDNPLRLLATPSSGLSPLSTQFSVSSFGAQAIVSFDLDFDGDGVPDLSSSAFTGTVPHIYSREGLFFPTLTATDSSGNRTTASAIVHVFLLPDLVGQWNGLRAALRQGDITAALQFIASDSRARYQGIFTTLVSALAQVDTILNDIQPVAVRGNTAEFSMLRVDGDGVQRSYYVLFIRDGDGLWRLLTF